MTNMKYIPGKDTPELGAVIKSAMAAQSMSLRKLSELSGISPASISRILTNKQAANMRHLQKFAMHLNIPIDRLFQAAGIGVGENTDQNSKLISSILRDVLKSFDIKLDDVIGDIQKELKKYEQYAKTAAGREAIHSGFLPKINELNGEGIIIHQFRTFYELFSSPDIDPNVQPVIGSALLYLILTPDVIPDYAFPVGYLDDAIAAVLTANRLSEEFHMSL